MKLIKNVWLGIIQKSKTRRKKYETFFPGINVFRTA